MKVDKTTLSGPFLGVQDAAEMRGAQELAANHTSPIDVVHAYRIVARIRKESTGIPVLSALSAVRKQAVYCNGLSLALACWLTLKRITPDWSVKK